MDIACGYLTEIMLRGEHKLVITHGNGSQVGNLLLASEAVGHVVPIMPLDVCGVATEGMMGYLIQQTLANRLRAVGLKHYIPVVRERDRSLRGVEAVIDKDLATERLAEATDANILMLLTNVEQVMLNYGDVDEIELPCMTSY